MLIKKVTGLNILACTLLSVQALFFSIGAAEEKPTLKQITSKESEQRVNEKLSSGPDDELKLHSVGVGVGQTFLTGDFEKNGDDSITADLLYNYSASHSFDLLVDFHHSKHKLANKHVTLNGTAVGIKGKLYQFDAFAPFVTGGLGFYAPKVKRELNGTLKESKSNIVFGTHLGVGAELRLNRHFMVGIMAHFHNPFDVKQELDPEIEGSYHKLLITTFYSF